jgi:hypothetical protein
MELVVEFWLRAELRRVLRGAYKRHDEEIALPHPRNITRETLAVVSSERAMWLAAPKLDGRRALLVRARVFGDEFVVDLDRKLNPTVLFGPTRAPAKGPKAPNGPNNGPNNGPHGPHGPYGPDEIRVVVDAEACGGSYHAHDVFVLGGVQTHTLRFSTRLDLVDEAIAELGVAGVVRKPFVPLSTFAVRSEAGEADGRRSGEADGRRSGEAGEAGEADGRRAGESGESGEADGRRAEGSNAVPTDGLILAHSAAPATFGSDPWVLKWKPPDKCTIDLIVERKKCGVHFSRRVAARTSNGRRALAEFDAAAFTGTLPCVFEFAMVGGRWTPIHRREDKATANTEFVVEQTVVAINEAITVDEITGTRLASVVAA